ncbi:ribosomal protein S18-alanine N-acetyltransferase [Kordiimonas aestuarii]|uniref:ribosomal protein S18-alanine N-acetyltransferase n=1 Tax=Kordiimonas aestuarii TaxID=1005925 RepID=UPI0021D260A0|nr:ribosomal protein S18-alanine N-acetyltransferase [Kordiimonas aestuarii]
MLTIMKMTDVPDDSVLDLLATIHAQAFAQQGDRAWRADEFLSLVEMPGAGVLLAVVQEEMAGFLLYRSAADEAELITIAVLPNQQGKRIALKLITDMRDRLGAMNVARVFLEVREDNERAIKLYKGIGFEITGKRPRYYQTQSGKLVDALCLCLILNNPSHAKEK